MKRRTIFKLLVLIFAFLVGGAMINVAVSRVRCKCDAVIVAL
jgi:hypothetical protein